MTHGHLAAGERMTADSSGGAADFAAYHLSFTEAARRIGTTLDEHATCLEVVGVLTPGFADASALDLLPAAHPAGRPPPGDAQPGLYRAAVAGPAGLLGTPPPLRAMRTGHPVLGGRVLAVPLLAHDQLIGAVLVARHRAPFTPDDIRSLQSVAARAALAVEHARLYGQARQTAVDLQRALLTDPGRPHPNLELATRYLPSGSGALVGGDWFATVRLHFGRTLLVMGDVMGHGVAAAVDMNSYRAMLREVAAADLPPHRVLRQLDTIIAAAESRRPATCLLVRVDPARGIGVFASAGHLPPVVFSREGVADVMAGVPVGPPLGTGLGGYEVVSRDLSPGDTLLLFTDGLIERRGEDIDTSLARLARVRPAPGGTVDDLLDEVLRELDAAHADDDVALMAARIRHRPPTQ